MPKLKGFGQQKAQPLTQQTFTVLGLTVLLTQLPLLFHLPLQLTLPGMLLTLIRLIPGLHSRIRFLPALMTPLVLLSAVAIVLYYGNFFSRDPCVVFLFLLINFKFIETRRINDASLIIVLCAFLLLTQFFYWQTIFAAMLAIPSMFTIGLSLFSLQRGTSSMPLRDMTNVTAKLFLQAIPIAAILFIAVPRLPSAGFGSGGEGTATTGLSSSMRPGSVSNLTKSNAVAFRVDFDGAPPPATDRYWRGPVLSGFDGVEWFINPSANRHYVMRDAANTPTSSARYTTYTVTAEPTSNPWLLALDTPSSLPYSGQKAGRKVVIGHINRELQVNATRRHNGAFRYQISSLLMDRFSPATPPEETSLFTANTNPAARRYASELRQRYPDDEMLVNQILRWFNREPFFYTLQPQTLGENGIDEFLFSTRRGFCEHYAGSFVFMLRAAGIPARVVTGYQGGEMNGDYMIVRQSDAHAWAEAYINGQWRRYDPTAAVAKERIESGFDAALGNEMTGLTYRLSQYPLIKSIALGWDAVSYKWQSWIIDFDSRTQNSFWQSIGLQKPKGWHVALILAAVSVLWALIILLPGSILRQADPCVKQWLRLQGKFSRHGVYPSSHETPTAYIARVSQHWPQHTGQLREILSLYQHGRFSAAAQDRRTRGLIAKKMRSKILRLGRLGAPDKRTTDVDAIKYAS
jgi:transglutaminase-like putative cysteine protease